MRARRPPRGSPRRGDVSYRGDRPGHNVVPKKGEWTGTAVPPSSVPEELKVFETSPFPNADPNYACTYDPERRLWRTQVFPALKPASRRDVELLEEWLAQAVGKLEARRREEQAKDADAGDRHEEQVLADEMRVLSLGFEELVRQVSVHCAERGRLLHAVWTRFNGLFEDVMGDMQRTIALYEGKMLVLQRSAQEHQEALAAALQTHKAEKQELIENASRRSNLKAGRLKGRIAELEERVTGFEALKGDVAAWLPNFAAYRSSDMRAALAAAAAVAPLELGLDPFEEEQQQQERELLADDALILDTQQLVRIAGLSATAPVTETEIRRRAQLDERVRSELVVRLQAAAQQTRALQKQLQAVEAQAEADREAARVRQRQAQQQLASVDGKLAVASASAPPAAALLPFDGLDAYVAHQPAPRAHQLLPPGVLERKCLRLLLHRVERDRQQGLRGLPRAHTPMAEWVFDQFVSSHAGQAAAMRDLALLVHSVRSGQGRSELVAHFGRACGVLAPAFAPDQESAYLRLLAYLGPYLGGLLGGRSKAALPRCRVPTRVALSSLRNVFGSGGALGEALAFSALEALQDRAVDLASREPAAEGEGEGEGEGALTIDVLDLLTLVLDCVDDEAQRADGLLRALFRAGCCSGVGLGYADLAITLQPLRLDLPHEDVARLYREGLALTPPATARERATAGPVAVVSEDAFVRLLRLRGVRTTAMQLPAHSDDTLRAATEQRWGAELATVQLVLAELGAKRRESEGPVREALAARLAHVQRLLATPAPPLECWLAVDLLKFEADAASDGGVKIHRLLALAETHRFERFAASVLRGWRQVVLGEKRQRAVEEAAIAAAASL